nr:HAD-IA family hydrolase [Lachnospiraceae bacterium]
GILSYQEWLIKPDREIYDLLLRRYELKPEECLFFDDRADNCETAERVGIHTHRFIGYEDAVAYLRTLGIL